MALYLLVDIFSTKGRGLNRCSVGRNHWSKDEASEEKYEGPHLQQGNKQHRARASVATDVVINACARVCVYSYSERRIR